MATEAPSPQGDPTADAQRTRTLPAVGTGPGPARAPATGRARLTGLLRGDLPWTLLIGALVVWTVTEAQIGADIGRTAPVLLGLLLVSGLVCIASLLAAPGTARPWGAGTLALGGALVVLTGASISWSVAPDASWQDANRILTYLAVMAAGVAGARLAPGRWQAPLGGVLLGSTVVVLLGLGHKVFPEAIDPAQVYARLQDPIGYWNGLGAIAAFALVLSLWLGSRRTGYQPLNALAYPIAAIAVLGLLQSYSRGGLAAAAVGVAVWIALAPRRLHSLLVLAVGVAGGGFVGIWTFANDALSTDNVALAARESAGAELGVLLVATLVVLLVVGLAIEFAMLFAGVGAAERRRLGVIVACAVAVVPIGGIAVVASSERGLTGSVSHAWTQLTDPDAAVPKGDPSRLGAVGSFRSRYWRQAFDVFEAQPLRGVGADGFGAVQPRVRTDAAVAKHAHGWVPQTLADLGWIGMLASLAFGLAFVAAAARALGYLRTAGVPARPRGGLLPERDGLVAATAIVATFAVTSVADWTWFVPGVTLPMMLLAGWVVGRGAESAFVPRPRPGLRIAGPRGVAAAGVAVAVVLAGLSVAGPWRSQRAQESAFSALERGDVAAAERDARDARRRDPLSADADYVLGTVLARKGDVDGARAAYEHAVERQPAVPDTWQRLARFELDVADRPYNAQRAAGVALRLAPTSRAAQLVAIAATRRATEKRAAREQRAAERRAARG